MSLQKELQELLDANVISTDIADSIEQYHRNKGSGGSNSLILIFGILGAILVGLGTILIVAHNWDELSRPVKMFLVFLPLVASQILGMYSLRKQPTSTALKESAATLIFFSVGACISLVTQIYNINTGNLSSFLLLWMVLTLPVVYILRSSVGGLLYTITATGFAVYAAEAWRTELSPYWYWVIIAAVLPFCYHVWKKQSESNNAVLLNWFVAVSLTIALGCITDNTHNLTYVSYMSMFGVMHIVSTTFIMKNSSALRNGLRFIASAGTVCLLLMLSFEHMWTSLYMEYLADTTWAILAQPPQLTAICMTILAAAALIHRIGRTSVTGIYPAELAFIAYLLIHFAPLSLTATLVCINLLILTLGVYIIYNGVQRNHLGIVNYGLVIITLLAACRFFDTDITFVVRGLLFVAVGGGFFVTNFLLLRKRRQHELR